MYRPGSHSSSGAYGDRYEDDRYGSREEDRSDHGYGREREWGYRDDDRYSRDGYRDDEYRRRSVDDDQYGSRSRGSDRDHDHNNFDDDGQRSSRYVPEIATFFLSEIDNVFIVHNYSSWGSFGFGS